MPAYAADTKSGIVPLTLKLAGQNETLAVSYCTEAGLFQDGGAPAIICGPGDIAQAHTANEFVAVAELEKCLAFLGRLADWAEAYVPLSRLSRGQGSGEGQPQTAASECVSAAHLASPPSGERESRSPARIRFGPATGARSPR